MVVSSTELLQTACSMQYICTLCEAIGYETDRNLGNQLCAAMATLLHLKVRGLQ